MQKNIIDFEHPTLMPINFSLILFILVVIEKTPVHHYGEREFDIFREYRFLILKIESFLCVLLI